MSTIITENQPNVTEEKQDGFYNIHEFTEFAYNKFEESCIKPSLYKHCTEIHGNIEFTDGNDVETPIHDALRWGRMTRFGNKATETFYGCFFMNETGDEDGQVWQVMLGQYDQEKNRNYIYRAPNENGDRAYLPPIDKDTRREVGKRHGVKVPMEGSFWEWVKNNKNIPIIITEGAKKALALLSLGYVAIALYGCTCGGKEELIPDLKQFLVNGRTWLFAFDQDNSRKAKASVKMGKDRIKRHLITDDYKVYIEDIEWRAEDGKGCDDLIANMGSGAFDIAYSKAVAKLEKQFATGATASNDDDEKTEKKFKPKELVVAQEIAEKYRQMLAFNNETSSWMRYVVHAYGKLKEGVWYQETNEFIESIVYKLLVNEGYRAFRSSFVTSLTKTLRHELILRDWAEKPPNEILPFANGVFDIKKGELLEHSPEYFLTWQLPRNYEPDGTWDNINQYLEHLSGYNPKMKEILLCYCNAILKGRSDLQKCLYLIGLPGTGKGTFLRLVSEMIGNENIHGTKLEIFCTDKFDVGNVRGKRLVLFSDQQPYSGSIGEFLSLTGQDLLRGERKNKDAKPFPYDGMALIAANHSVFFGKSLNAVARRLINFPCNTLVPKEMKKDLMPLFEPEIGAFTAFVLSIPDDRVTQVLANGDQIQECSIDGWEHRMEADALAAWANDCLIFEPMAMTASGKNRNEWKDGTPYTLFGSYAQYVEQSGRGQCNANRFANDLIDLCNQHMGRIIERDKKTR